MGLPEDDDQILDVLSVFVDRFSPGKLVWIDGPHFMEVVAAEEISEELRVVIALASAPDGLFDIGDRELFLECVGTGSPTVIFEPGEGEDHTTFASLQEQVSQDNRACVYDRANIGASGSAPTPRTGDEVVGDLRNLLDVAGVDGPYVLVGFSAGATFVLLTRARTPTMSSASWP